MLKQGPLDSPDHAEPQFSKRVLVRRDDFKTSNPVADKLSGLHIEVLPTTYQWDQDFEIMITLK